VAVTQAVQLFNGALTGLFDLLFWPFRSLDPIWPLIVVSLVAGVLMLWLFGKVSDQETIRRVRDGIRGNLMAIRLFGDDVGLLFRLQGRILRQTGAYLRYALVPMLIMLVPVLLILIQLNLRYGARPLAPGERTVVTVKLRDPALAREGVTLRAPEGVTVETPGVRVISRGEVSWRVRAEQPGRHALQIEAGGNAVEKELRVGGTWGATSTLRTGSGLLDELLYPGETPIPQSSPIEVVRIQYPALSLRAFGWGVDWLLAFFVLSIVFGFAFRRALGVEI